MSGLPASLLFVLGLVACGPRPGAHPLDCDAVNRREEGGPPLLQLEFVDGDRSEVARGYLLFTQSEGDASWAGVLDGCAAHVWWRAQTDPDLRVYRAHVSDDRQRVMVAEHNREHRPDRSAVLEVDLATDEVVRTTRIPEGHHDFAELPGSRISWISWQYLENTWFPNLQADVVTDVVRTADLGERAETDQRLFSLYDTVGMEPWWTCVHMNPTSQIPGYAEWSHSNSLMYEPVSNRLFLYARYWDALLAFDADSGALDWSLGGPMDAFEAKAGTTLPSHAHLSHLWDGGALFFDNANHVSDASRVVELAWDEAAGTVEEVWSYSDGTFVSYLGDARKLPGGNVLIAWSTDGRFTEVTPDGDVVWEARTQDPEGTVARVDFHTRWPPR